MPGLENQIKGKHDFDGECAPAIGGTYAGQENFSVGIFRWLPRASGKGLKKSKVIYRVRGKVDNVETVYGRARSLCKFYDYLLSKEPDWKGPSKKSEII